MHHHHEWLWHLYPKKELTRVYISLALRYFALSLISLFIPLYLYKEIGYSFEQTILFFIFYSLVLGIFSPLAAKCCEWYGVKHTVLISIPFYLAFLILLNLLPKVKLNLLWLGLLVGISLSFYWIGMNLLFYHSSHHKHRGEESGKRLSASIIASLIGPVVGGLLINVVGFYILFVLSALFLFISALVLFLSKDEHIHYEFSLRSLVDKHHWRHLLYFISQGSYITTSGVIWPLFMFSILGGYFSLGILGSLLSGVGAVLILFVGKYSDHVEKRTIIRWSAIGESTSWFVRAFVQTVGQVYAATIFGAMTYGIMVSPLQALDIDSARGRASGYFVTREVFICLGRMSVLIIVLMTNSLSGGLIAHGILNFAALLF